MARFKETQLREEPFSDSDDGFGLSAMALVHAPDDEEKAAAYYDKETEIDPVKLVLKEVSQVPLLTGEEEVALAKRVEAGEAAREKIDKLTQDKNVIADKLRKKIADLEKLVQDGEDAREHLIRANGRLVVSIAKRFQGRGVLFLDLIQEGQLGLIKAVSKYEWRRGHKFSTYATWWIRQTITRAIADQGRTIRYPVHLVEEINALFKISRALEQELGHEPKAPELALRILKIKLGHEPTEEERAAELPGILKQVEKLLKLSQHPMSLNQEIKGTDEGTLDDVIEDTNYTDSDPQVVAANVTLREQIDEILNRFTPREQRIIRFRYGLEDGQVHTLEEVGKAVRLTRERVRQIESQIFRRIRNSSGFNLRDYLDTVE